MVFGGCFINWEKSIFQKKYRFPQYRYPIPVRKFDILIRGEKLPIVYKNHLDSPKGIFWFFSGPVPTYTLREKYAKIDCHKNLFFNGTSNLKLFYPPNLTIFQSLFVGALSIIGTYNFLNEDEEAAADNDESDERSQHLQDYEKKGPRQIKPEDCYVHRGFNRQYKECDQSRFAMTRHSLFI